MRDQSDRGCRTVPVGAGQCDDEREHRHDQRDHGREAEDSGQLDSGVLQRARAEGGDAVAELVERDDRRRRPRPTS